MSRTPYRSNNLKVVLLQAYRVGKLLNLQIHSAGHNYEKLYLKLKHNHGHDFALVVLKDIYNEAKRKVLQQKYIPNNSTIWCKANRSGFTKYEKFIFGKDHYRLLVENDTNFHRFALTILSSYEVLTKKVIEPDVLTLTAKSTSTMKRAELRSIRSYLLKRCWIPKQKPALGPITDFWSIKGGPYGPSTISWKKDLDVLRHHQSYRFITSIEDKLHLRDGTVKCSELPSSPLSNNKINDRLYKTIAIPDKGPKVRTITMGNYFVQRTLKPIHNCVMEYLRNIPEDGTFKQDSAALSVKERTKVCSPYCFDLSSATDRWPVLIQYYCLKRVLPSLAGEWYALMSKCTSVNGSNNQKIVFEVGQPMGIYSSWPVFALSHHMIIRYAFHRAQRDFRGNYYIIGDDVVIFDKVAALGYKEIVQSLGVLISKTKSITPESSINANHCGEFAKRYFRNGLELSPVRPNSTLSLRGKGWFNLNEFRFNLLNRWYKDEGLDVSSSSIVTTSNCDNLPVPEPHLFLDFVDNNKRTNAALLISSPLGRPRVINFGIPIKAPRFTRTEDDLIGWWGRFSDAQINEQLKNLGRESYSSLTTTMLELEQLLEKKLPGGTTSSNLDTSPHSFRGDPEREGLLKHLEDAKAVFRNKDLSFIDRALRFYEIGLNIDMALVYYSSSVKVKDYLDLKSKRRASVACLAINLAKYLAEPPSPRATMLGQGGSASQAMMLKMMSKPSRLKTIKREILTNKASRRLSKQPPKQEVKNNDKPKRPSLMEQYENTDPVFTMFRFKFSKAAQEGG